MKLDTLAKQIMFSTVRIRRVAPNGKATIGTGFVFNAGTSLESNETVAILISNKHILEGASELEFDFLARNVDNSGPDLGRPPRKHRVVGPAVPTVFGHPDVDVDVAVMPFGDLILAMDESERPYLLMLNWWHLPSASTLSQLDVIEELTFVGYPDGWMDEVHGTPIVRQAITATPVMLPFDGSPTFLVDGSIFGGSSGSPVFILNRGSWTGPQGLSLGDRLLLVGIIASTGIRKSDLPVQVSKTPFVRLSQELDLGIAFSVQAITEAINHALTTSGLPTFQGMC
jgi:hypothetical protein